MFTRNKTLIYCGICWIIGITIDMPNFLGKLTWLRHLNLVLILNSLNPQKGWGGHAYDNKTLNCMWNRLASQSYSIFFPMSSIIIPCLLILFCYTRIGSFVIRSKQRVLKSKRFRSTLRVTKGLFASFFLFTICW